jgi:carbonic anhydrase
MKQSPTALSLAHLRKTCDAVQVVEKWNPFVKQRKDLFGFIDIVALQGETTIAVQSTSWSNVSSRAKKIAESDLVSAVRKAGWKIVIHGWKKDAKTNRYVLKEVDVS